MYLAIRPQLQGGNSAFESWFGRRAWVSRMSRSRRSRVGDGVNRTWSRAVVVAGVGAGVIAARRIVIRQAGNGAAAQAPDRWHSVTVNRPPEEVAPEGRLPEPLAALGDAVEVRLRPAPGDRGTEVAARLRQGAPAGPGGVLARAAGSDPRHDLRAALRQAKQLLETGEVLNPDKQPTARRTLRNLPLELATRRARGEGRL
jgi:uncharacterized membrane protein